MPINFEDEYDRLVEVNVRLHGQVDGLNRANIEANKRMQILEKKLIDMILKEEV